MLRYAYFADAKPGPRLLIWGDSTDMHRLYEAMAAVNEGECDGETGRSLDDIPSARSVDGSTVLLERTGEARGLERDPVEPGVFRWCVDTEGWASFMEQVEELTHCSPQRPGHQVLSCLADGEIGVVVSCGEYPDDLAPARVSPT